MIHLRNTARLFFANHKKNLKLHLQEQLAKKKKASQQNIRKKQFLVFDKKSPIFLYGQFIPIIPLLTPSLIYFFQPFSTTFLLGFNLVQAYTSMLILLNHNFQGNKKFIGLTATFVVGMNIIPGIYGILSPVFLGLSILILQQLSKRKDAQKAKLSQQQCQYAVMAINIKVIILTIFIFTLFGKLYHWNEVKNMENLINKYKKMNL